MKGNILLQYFRANHCLFFWLLSYSNR